MSSVTSLTDNQLGIRGDIFYFLLKSFVPKTQRSVSSDFDENLTVEHGDEVALVPHLGLDDLAGVLVLEEEGVVLVLLR